MNHVRNSVGILIGAFVLLALAKPSPAPGQEELLSPKSEFKAVSFGSDEKDNTKKLNDLAAEGWEYVGPLGNGMVAFKRPSDFLAAKKALDSLQGTCVADGGVDPFTFEDNRWVWGKGKYSGTFRIVDASKKLLSVDLFVEEGKTKGQTLKAIFQIDGDVLQYCGTYEFPRATEFIKDAEPRYAYVAFKRQKKQ